MERQHRPFAPFLFALLLLMGGLAIGETAFAEAPDCYDGIDNDGNSFTDCDDPGCSAHFLCGGSETSCADSTDNDFDGLADCADPDCAGMISPAGFLCEYGAETLCADGADNNYNGLVDCDDPWDCGRSPDCYELLCFDGADSDADGFTDCADPDCGGGFSTGPNGEVCEPGTEFTCDDGHDNDADGNADCADMDCAGQPGPGSTICEAPGEAACGDLLDNDGDGSMDCADSDCSAAPGCAVEEVTVSNAPTGDASSGHRRSGRRSRSGGSPVGKENFPIYFYGEEGSSAGSAAAPANDWRPSAPALPPGCEPYLLSPLGTGRENPTSEVSKLQSILRVLIRSVLPQTGVFDEATAGAVREFQSEHEDEILRPWGEGVCPGGVCQPTGFVGITTMRFINRLVCGS